MIGQAAIPSRHYPRERASCFSARLTDWLRIGFENQQRAGKSLAARQRMDGTTSG